jgi:glutaredoxin 3
MTDKQVVIYSTPTCPYCKRAKDYLTRKGISYLEHNVALDRDAAKEMVKKSGQLGVPVILIDDEVIIGFNQAQLDKILDTPAPS